MKRLFIVGTGAVGTGLALAASRVDIPVVGLWNRSGQGLKRAEALLGKSSHVADLAEGVASADLVLVCVRDEAIAEIAHRLRDVDKRPGQIIAHTSGCLPGSALGEQAPAECGSIHPVLACTDPEQAARSFRGAFFGVEGSPNALRALETLVRAIGGRPVGIDATQKPRYHAACVMASNLLVGLLDQAVREAEAAGFSQASEALGQLALHTVRQVVEQGPQRALTGPVVRGDVETVRQHLRRLRGARPLYTALCRVVLKLAEQRGLDRAKVEAITKLLEPV